MFDCDIFRVTSSLFDLTEVWGFLSLLHWADDTPVQLLCHGHTSISEEVEKNKYAAAQLHHCL